VKTKTTQPFITYLYSLASQENRGALADLRRGLTTEPGTSPAMYPYVAPWVPEPLRYTWKEKVYYLIAALFAYYQSGSSANQLTTTQGNFGSHCRALVTQKPQSASFEPRFSALLKAHRDDLPILLKQILSILRGEDIPINWDQLFLDLQYWNTENHIVQRRWANSYWIYAGSPEQTPSEITQ
jgi:CRISPR system Cascade subunit CasB